MNVYAPPAPMVHVGAMVPQQIALGAAYDAIPLEQLPHMPKPTRRNAWLRYLLPNFMQFGGIVLAIAGFAIHPVVGVLGLMTSLAGGILEVIWLYTMAAELHALTQTRDFSPVFCVVPGMGRWLRFEGIPNAMQVAKRRIGARERRKHRLAYFFLCKWAFSEDLNDILDVLDGQVAPHSGGPDAHKAPANFMQAGWY